MPCPVLHDAVEADSQDLQSGGFHPIRVVAQRATLNRSARGVGFRIEPEQDLPAEQIGQTNGLTVVIPRGERGSFGTGVEHVNLLLVARLSAKRVLGRKRQCVQ
jgi:hypothetical protein